MLPGSRGSGQDYTSCNSSRLSALAHLGKQGCFCPQKGLRSNPRSAPVGSAITPPTPPGIAVPPIPMAVPPASARIINANHSRPRNSHARPRSSHDRPRNGDHWSTIGTTEAVRSPMESDATSLGGFGGRGCTQHGSNGNDTDNRLSHINLFSLILVPPQY